MSYVELMKPELTGLSVLSAICSYFVAWDGVVQAATMFWLAAGTLLVGGGAGALNEYFERDYDAHMRRTEKRPIPSGRIAPLAALVFGNVIGVVGLLTLALFVNILTAFLAALTLATYLMLYTPLKRVAWWNTLVGAIPGALPTLIGWAAARNEINAGGWILFAILFAWQIPHFLSLAWMYKKDYARAGFKMLPVIDDSGRKTSLQIFLSTVFLIALTVFAAWHGLAGFWYLACAVLLGAGFLSYAFMFRRSSLANMTSDANIYSRRVFFASLVYLPALMVALVADKI